MHKQLILACVVGIAVLTALLAVSVNAADSGNPWLTSSLFLQKEVDTQALPSAKSGNIDCFIEGDFICSVPTPYGSSAGSTVRLRSDGSYKPVLSYLENRDRFLAVPNSDVAITYTSSPFTGLYLYFNDHLLAGLQHTTDFVSGATQKVYKMTAPPDGQLADKSGRRLPIDTVSISFSANGKWMVASVPNIAMIRVNLETYEVLPFGAMLDYSIGLSPAPKTAITNDGRYAVVASKDFNRFRLYDLNTCGDFVPDTFNAPLACGSRDLEDFMSRQVPGYTTVGQARFLSDDTLAVYAGYKLEAINKTARFIISTSGIPSQIDYLAMGDSYISGEGAFDYQGGTDSQDNHCHLSFASYPYLIGRDLNYSSYHSVACSGATTTDITDNSDTYNGQADNKATPRRDRTSQEIDDIFASFKPGYINQSDFVSRYRPKAITASVFGDDVGMIGKLKNCLYWPSTCFNTYEDRLEFVREINNRFPKLVNTYAKVKTAASPDMRLYAVGYPQIAKPGGDCAVNVRLNNDELIFVEQAIDYLDSVIEKAAAKAGIFYVDAKDALYGHRMCEDWSGHVAANGVTAGNDLPSRFGGPIGSESFHPNALGYELLRDKVLEATNNLNAPMPAADLTAAPPAEAGLAILDAPHSGRPVKITEYDPGITGDVIYIGNPSEVSVDGAAHALSSGITLQAELHSAPTPLGSYTTGALGNLTAQITIPSDVPAGYHTLHFYGTDISGQPIDIYKDIYVAASLEDMDGDGIADSGQACVGVPPSGDDYDQDGIDDACDGTIGNPPPPAEDPEPDPGTITDPEPDPSDSGDPAISPPDGIPIDDTPPPDDDIVVADPPSDPGGIIVPEDSPPAHIAGTLLAGSITVLASDKSGIPIKPNSLPENFSPQNMKSLQKAEILAPVALSISAAAALIWKLLLGFRV